MEGYLHHIAKRLKHRRNERRWSIRELAEKSGLSQRYIISAEHGRANLSLQKLDHLARALDIPLVSLFVSGATERLLTLTAEMSDREIQGVCDRLEGEKGTTNRVPHIALLGVRGAGKSTVGELLAKTLHCRFVELDHEIERVADLRLADIFAWHGESYYRKLERSVLLTILEDEHPCVIATGGGIVTHEETFSILRDRTTTIWLCATAESHWSRVVAQGDERPMLNHPHAMAELRTLLVSRTGAYEQADHRIETDEFHPREIAETLAKILK
ncbi:MAG: shikimate kinase [Bradymonadia bacterium]